MHREADIHHRLAKQGLRRPLTPDEEGLAAALEEIFGAGEHEFGAVARLLNERRTVRPSGAPEPWTIATLQHELELINRSLDVAYATAPALAPYR